MRSAQLQQPRELTTLSASSLEESDSGLNELGQLAVDLSLTAMRVGTCALMVHHGIDKIENVEGFSANVVANYFEQNQADALDLDKTVLETVQAAAKNGETYNEIRALLGQFLFKGDAVEKKVRALSGGEKARVALCCMMLTPGNLLVMDEPTNHLDIPAKEMIESALQAYDGAVLIVSHDRYFVSQVATTICALEDRTLVRYDGDYRMYMERDEDLQERLEARYVAGSKGIQSVRKAPEAARAAAMGEQAEKNAKRKKSFGGKMPGVSGDKTKGIKNAKRINA